MRTRRDGHSSVLFARDIVIVIIIVIRMNIVSSLSAFRSTRYTTTLQGHWQAFPSLCRSRVTMQDVLESRMRKVCGFQNDQNYNLSSTIWRM